MNLGSVVMKLNISTDFSLFALAYRDTHEHRQYRGEGFGFKGRATRKPSSGFVSLQGTGKEHWTGRYKTERRFCLLSRSTNARLPTPQTTWASIAKSFWKSPHPISDYGSKYTVYSCFYRQVDAIWAPERRYTFARDEDEAQRLAMLSIMSSPFSSKETPTAVVRPVIVHNVPMTRRELSSTVSKISTSRWPTLAVRRRVWERSGHPPRCTT
ncbi:hypothetical protein WG66_012633 [Moniliophthora roreri]|nr:hypothetical protein WG66_012633 [Moniliophthora roreri]